MYKNDAVLRYLDYFGSPTKNKRKKMEELRAAMVGDFDLIKKRKRRENDLMLESSDDDEDDQNKNKNSNKKYGYFEMRKGEKIFDMYKFVYHLIDKGFKNEMTACKSVVAVLNGDDKLTKLTDQFEQEMTRLQNTINSGNVRPISIQEMNEVPNLGHEYDNEQQEPPPLPSVPAQRQVQFQSHVGADRNMGDILTNPIRLLTQHGSMSSRLFGEETENRKVALTHGDIFTLSVAITNEAQQYFNPKDAQTLMHTLNVQNNLLFGVSGYSPTTIVPINAQQKLEELFTKYDMKNTDITSFSMKQRIWQNGVISTVQELTRYFGSCFQNFHLVIAAFNHCLKNMYNCTRQEIMVIQRTVAGLCDVMLNIGIYYPNVSKELHLGTKFSRLTQFRNLFDTFVEKFLFLGKRGFISCTSMEISDIELARIEAEIGSLNKTCLMLNSMDVDPIITNLYHSVNNQNYRENFLSMLYFFININ